MALESGSRLGPYEVVDLLGSGGMGEVYRARDPRLEREVAVKVLPDGIADGDRLRRFELEARAAGALNHPNVLAVYDVGSHGGAPYVVSELLEGQTLRAHLEGGALPLRTALDYALQIAQGLAAAHDKGIVHRDLKPENVFITEDGRVKILDFGLAKLTRRGPLVSDDDGSCTRATESGSVVGTVGYMSPEQVRAETVDHRSDIFALGTVLYEMLSGRRAFRSASSVETLNAILKEDPTDLSQTGPAISPGLARIVHRCLEKRAGDRFHSVHDLALALEAASSGLSGPSPTESGASDAALALNLARRHKTAWLAALAVVALAAGGLYLALARSPEPPVAGVIDSVAVLPFENASSDPDTEYLSDGVAESLINKLSQLSDLRVIARSTTFRFRGSDVDPQQVGRDLGVGAVLTGRVASRGDTLVIGVEMVDVAQGIQLWGERYSTPLGDVFAMEESIAGDIARGLRLELAPRDETLLARRHTENDEAYRLYLLSRYALNQGRPKEALDYAREATEQDPGYALAHAALARAYSSLGEGGLLPYREAFSGARAAALKALQLDDELAEGHVALADAVLKLDWDWVGAERGFRRAVDLNPGSADAHGGYAYYLSLVGHTEQALTHQQRALELDPLTPGRHIGLAFQYFWDYQYDRALAEWRKATELNPDLESHFLRAWIHKEQGEYEEALGEWTFGGEDEEAPARGGPALPGDLSRAHPHNLGHLGNLYARAGRPDDARECLRELKERLKDGSVGVYEVAMIHAGLEEKDEAFEWLERAYEERDKGLVYLKVDHNFDPLHSDPRFRDLLQRIGFPS